MHEVNDAQHLHHGPAMRLPAARLLIVAGLPQAKFGDVRGPLPAAPSEASPQSHGSKPGQFSVRPTAIGGMSIERWTPSPVPA